MLSAQKEHRSVDPSQLAGEVDGLLMLSLQTHTLMVAEEPAMCSKVAMGFAKKMKIKQISSNYLPGSSLMIAYMSSSPMPVSRNPTLA